MAGDRRQGRASAHGAAPVEPAFLEAMAVRYRVALKRFFERRAPHLASESEDLTQEVFVRLARRADTHIERPDAYIFQTASSVLTDRVRRRAVRCADSHVEYEFCPELVEELSPERVLLAREQVEMVRIVLEGLPDNVRAAFVLHRFEELGYSEIARRLGVSVSSVEKYISHALKVLTAARAGDAS